MLGVVCFVQGPGTRFLRAHSRSLFLRDSSFCHYVLFVCCSAFWDGKAYVFFLPCCFSCLCLCFRPWCFAFLFLTRTRFWSCVRVRCFSLGFRRPAVMFSFLCILCCLLWVPKRICFCLRRCMLACIYASGHICCVSVFARTRF